MEWGKMMREVYRVFKKRSEEQMDHETRISPEQFDDLPALHVENGHPVAGEEEVALADDAVGLGQVIDHPGQAVVCRIEKADPLVFLR